MTTPEERAAVIRAETLQQARRLAQAWGWWCVRSKSPLDRSGIVSGGVACGGMDRRYQHPQRNHWHPPEPKLPEADENTGLAVQKSFIRLPEVFRNALRVEFCERPWLIVFTDHDLETVLARKARVSIGSYRVTVDRSLLALANVMKRRGEWRA